MWRGILLVAIIFLPIFFGWWLFVPLALLYVYFIKSPYEIIPVGAILDGLYYFGEGFLYKHSLVLYTLVLVVLTSLLGKWISWKRSI